MSSTKRRCWDRPCNRHSNCWSRSCMNIRLSIVCEYEIIFLLGWPTGENKLLTLAGNSSDGGGMGSRLLSSACVLFRSLSRNGACQTAWAMAPPGVSTYRIFTTHGSVGNQSLLCNFFFPLLNLKCYFMVRVYLLMIAHFSSSLPLQMALSSKIFTLSKKTGYT